MEEEVSACPTNPGRRTVALGKLLLSFWTLTVTAL